MNGDPDQPQKLDEECKSPSKNSVKKFTFRKHRDETNENHQFFNFKRKNLSQLLKNKSYRELHNPRKKSNLQLVERRLKKMHNKT